MIQHLQKHSAFEMDILRGEYADEMVIKIVKDGETKYLKGKQTIIFAAMLDGLWAQPNDKAAERKFKNERN